MKTNRSSYPRTLLVLFSGLLLAVACSLSPTSMPVPTATPTAASEPTTGSTVVPTSTSQPTATALPPSLVATSTPVSPTIVPQAPLTLPNITWAEAEQLILDGKVKSVMQAHSLQVQLTLVDGSTRVTVEPRIDDVFKVVNKCGDRCSGMMIATK